MVRPTTLRGYSRLSLTGGALLLVALCAGCAETAPVGEPRSAGCSGGKCDTASRQIHAGSVGSCRRFTPFLGYATCLMSKAQNTLHLKTPPVKPTEPGALPSKVDHRDEYLAGCLVVHDQGGCGWCTAHATTASLEAMLCKQKLGPERVSEPHLWFLGNERGEIKDCAGGWYISSAFYELANATANGTLLVGASHWPYSDQIAQLNADKPSDADLKAYGRYGAAWSSMLSVPAADAASLKAALASGHNVVYSVPTFKATGWSYEDPSYGSIQAPSPEPPGLCDCETCPTEVHCLEGYHAVLIVGYDDASSRFEFLNSWTTWWGDSGYGKIAYDLIDKHGNGGWTTSAITVAKLADKPPVALLRYNSSTPATPDDYPYDGKGPAQTIAVGSTIYLSSALSSDPEHEKITRSLTITAPDGWEVWLDKQASAIENNFTASQAGSYHLELTVEELGPAGQKTQVGYDLAVGGSAAADAGAPPASPDAGVP